MARLEIKIFPDPFLRKQARKIAKITPKHKQLAEDMVETMNEHNGVGLAAPQVGHLERMVVIQTPEMEEAMVLVNPEILRKEGEREVEEGCLSVPGYRGKVLRSEKVRAQALGLDSKRFRLDADDLLAQALEHEIDHLNGIMYMDHLVQHTELWKIEEQTFGEEEDESDETDQHEHPSGPGFDDLHRRLHGLDPETESDTSQDA